MLPIINYVKLGDIGKISMQENGENLEKLMRFKGCEGLRLGDNKNEFLERKLWTLRCMQIALGVMTLVIWFYSIKLRPTEGLEPSNAEWNLPWATT